MPWSTGRIETIAGAGQAAVVEQPLEVAEHAGVAVAGGEDAVDEIGAGQVQRLSGDRLAHVCEQAVGLVAEELADGGRHGWRLSDARPVVAVPRGGGRRHGSAWWVDAIRRSWTITAWIPAPKRADPGPCEERSLNRPRTHRADPRCSLRRPRGDNRIELHHKTWAADSQSSGSTR